MRLVGIVLLIFMVTAGTFVFAADDDKHDILKPNNRKTIFDFDDDNSGKPKDKSWNELKLFLGKGVELKLVKVPAGKFLMGSPKGKGRFDEHPQRRVTVGQAFFIGLTEVTQKQYKTVMGTNPSRFKGDKKPVERVSWREAVAFCRKLSAGTGKNVRLPTEAQWEYACRAGTEKTYYFSDKPKKLAQYAWYRTNSKKQTHPVGLKKPNVWGLFDMSGNVWEWCADPYYGRYDAEGSSNKRTCRGGSWNSLPYYCRSAHRKASVPSTKMYNMGFRIVIVSGKTTVKKPAAKDQIEPAEKKVLPVNVEDNDAAKHFKFPILYEAAQSDYDAARYDKALAGINKALALVPREPTALKLKKEIEASLRLRDEVANDLIKDIISAVKTDAEKAMKLFEVSQLAESDELKVILLEKVVEYGLKSLKSPKARSATEKSLDMLIKKAPGRKQTWLGGKIALYRYRYKFCSNRRGKAAAGKTLVSLLLELGEIFEKRGQWGKPVALYRQANIIAARLKMPQKDKIFKKYHRAFFFDKALRNVARYRSAIEKNPGNTKARTALVRTLLIDLNSPDEARKYLSADVEKTWRTNIPLAARDVDALDEKSCIELGQWYHKVLAPSANDIVKPVLLRRAETYYARYLKLHKPRDAKRLKVKFLKDNLRKRLLKSS